MSEKCPTEDSGVVNNPKVSRKKRKLWNDGQTCISDRKMVVTHTHVKLPNKGDFSKPAFASSLNTDSGRLVSNPKDLGALKKSCNNGVTTSLQHDTAAVLVVRRKKKKIPSVIAHHRLGYSSDSVKASERSESLPAHFMSLPSRYKASDLKICKLQTETNPLMREWKTMIEGFFRVPKCWQPTEYFKGCILIALTGVVADERILLGAAATEKLNPEDHDFASIIHAFIVKPDYRSQGLGKKFWVLLGYDEFVEIPICAYVKISEEKALKISEEYSRICGEALSKEFLDKITSKEEPSEEQKAEFMNRVIDGGNIDLLQQHIRKHLVSVNGAFRFWERLQFDVTPRVYGRNGGDLIVGMSLGFYL